MMRARATFALLGVAFLAGCGGGGGGETDGTATSGGAPAAPAAPGGTAGASAQLTLTISGLDYFPPVLQVPPGGTVTVVNTDGTPHSVTSESSLDAFTPGAVNGVSFDTGIFATGERTFTIPAGATVGTVVPYYCTEHGAMMRQGRIVVGSATSSPSDNPMPSGY